MSDWVSCAAGALTRGEYHAALERAGFAAVSLRDSHPVGGSLTSVLVSALKPDREPL
ncbi:hypothetical protein BH18ACT4_BH18ACT4_11210 [soil metagenome]